MADYSFGLFVRTGFELLLTKLFFRKARLVRRPIYIRGKKGFVYGRGLTTGHGCRIEASSKKKTLFIGENARIGDYVHICAEESVVIGDNVLIASKVFISDTNHGDYSGDNQSSPNINPAERELFHNPVFIGNNVWIGENVVILPGSIIGNGCVIGANSVVNGKKYPDNCIIAGIPSKIIKQYNPESCRWERLI